MRKWKVLKVSKKDGGGLLITNGSTGLVTATPALADEVCRLLNEKEARENATRECPACGLTLHFDTPAERRPDDPPA